MADTFNNDLRVREQEAGSNSGTWGTLLNATISNLASAFGQGSEAIPNATTHTITLADGAADEARSMYLKCTGGGQACTVTLAPNTISKVWIISNETSYTLTFTQGSGANVAVSAGSVKMIVTDGAGSGAAVTDALSGLELSAGLVTTSAIADDAVTAAKIADDGVGADQLASVPVSVGITTAVTAASMTATVNTHVYVGAAGRTITLPASPTIGQRVLITVGNFTDTVVGRNGSNIMSSASDFTMDAAYLSIQFIYTDATQGWVMS